MPQAITQAIGKPTIIKNRSVCATPHKCSDSWEYRFLCLEYKPAQCSINRSNIGYVSMLKTFLKLPHDPPRALNLLSTREKPLFLSSACYSSRLPAGQAGPERI